MDISGALNHAQVAEQLDLALITDRPFYIVFEIKIFLIFIYLLFYFILFYFESNCLNYRSSNALTGEGIDDGVNWLTEKTSETS